MCSYMHCVLHLLIGGCLPSWVSSSCIKTEVDCHCMAWGASPTSLAQGGCILLQRAHTLVLCCCESLAGLRGGRCSIVLFLCMSKAIDSIAIASGGPLCIVGRSGCMFADNDNGDNAWHNFCSALLAQCSARMFNLNFWEYSAH